MRIRTALALAVLAGCTAAGDAAPDGGAPDALGPDGMPGASLGTFELTYYWVAYEGDHPGAADTPLHDDDCGVIATVSADFADAIALEGTGRLLDGRLLNVSGACACPQARTDVRPTALVDRPAAARNAGPACTEGAVRGLAGQAPCFVEVDDAHPWGYGVQSRALVPFHTVAVDRDVIEYGDGLYLPALDGVAMPGEAPWGDFVHDGCVVAGDTGGGIVGMHVDLFVGLREAYLELDGVLELSALEVIDGGDRCADEPAP